MNIELIPALSLMALVVAILLSGFKRVQLGILAMSLAYFLGLIANIPAQKINLYFPTDLFLTLISVNLLFGIARINGTLSKLIYPVFSLFRTWKQYLPIAFFLLAAIFSTAGVGNIGTVALLAPVALTLSSEGHQGSLLMIVMIVFGANAGAISPFSFTGVIANGLAAKQGFNLNPWTQIYWPNMIAQSSMAFICFIALSWSKNFDLEYNLPKVVDSWSRSNSITTIALALFIIGVAVFKLDVGFWGLFLCTVLLVSTQVDIKMAQGTIAWEAILMVCGMSLLMSTINAVGGLEVLSTLVSHLSQRGYVAGVLAAVAGLTSIYSSSSGVVMPTFISLTPQLMKHLQIEDPSNLISAINIGSHIVDVSPLSTLGAICLSQAGGEAAKKSLFRQLLLLSFLTGIIGSIACHFVFDRF